MPTSQLFREVVDVKPPWVVVRVDVALPPAELLRAEVVRVAELVGWANVAVLPDVGRRLLERDVARVGLRGAGEVDRGLREVQPRFREPDVLDGVSAMTEKLAAAGLPPEKVARVVEHALTARRPRRDYIVGRDAKMQIALDRVLPTRVFDGLVRRFMGI